ncbi:endopeptidase La [Spirochaeta lutea]|uniref:Lon protease n=1 Tax=Spirochaeta lutea TaxID=1480694 RepID=A0A098QV00_9SPIO|nr:endopeptidase La [Spirochaeta lutea]KGE71361.1 Lon protease [Spirochaeta lutea]
MADQNIVPSDQTLPNKIRVLPLMGKPIFPGIFTPLMINSPEDLKTVEDALQSDNSLGLVLVENEETENPSSNDLFSVGTLAKIVKKINLPDGGMNIFISTIKRFKIKKVIQSEIPITVAVEYPEEVLDDTLEVKALTRSLITEMKAVSENNPLFSEEMRLNMVNIDQPGKIADFITSILNIDREEQQRVLETFGIKKRMERVLLFIKKEQELLKIQKKIQNQINDKIEKSQRDYFLREQLKAIKQELGIAVDGKTEEYNRFKEIVDSLEVEDDIREQIEKELDKFALMEPNSSDYHVTRNYLDTIVSLPWNDPPPVEIDLKKAQRILDADHYGLEDVKERILEFIAVHKMKKDFRGSIILLVGPPGVGKTSIGKSIARALGRKFFRFSVGGMRDEAEIKGHRRTYVGAMPGKIIQGLKIVKTKDPVFMIDEIDKLGASFQGDPSSALLEVLDSEQNNSFRDHYLDLPFDVSRVLFIATANSLDTIPRPLMDRMEIIRLSGYITKEKLSIAKKYIIPKSLDRNGMTKDQVQFDYKALTAIAEGYAREAGMRNFEKAVDKVNRKIAKKLLVEEVQPPVTVTREDLTTYLGQPYFREDDAKTIIAPGMVTGLAWTNFGGDTLIIESVAVPGKEGFKLTGQMGSVMQESANIAYTYVRYLADSLGIAGDWFSKHTIHIHIPAGATPKDGPSAGITMASTLVSLALGKKVSKKIAMTGELSLAGRVLPIGGLKEKTIAAKRATIKDIIIPKANERDLDEIPDYVKKGLTFHPVEEMAEVLRILFGELKDA